jgi:hypothetical protein
MTDDDEPTGGGLGAFLRENWIWWLAPLVIAVVAIVLLLWLSEGDAGSPFVYDEF